MKTPVIKFYVDLAQYPFTEKEKPYFENKTLDADNAGYDLRVCSVIEGTIKNGVPILPDEHGFFDLKFGQLYSINTGIKVEIPAGWHGEMALRSSAFQAGFAMPDTGRVDPNYRGYIYGTMRYWGTKSLTELMEHSHGTIRPPDLDREIPAVSARLERYSRLFQMIVTPYLKMHAFVEQESELSDTTRGTKGFGGYTGTGK